MTASRTTTRTELAHRSNAGIDVSLMWVRRNRKDAALVCVWDYIEDAYFEIPAEAHLALDVYYHPFFYRDFSTIDHEASRFAA
jgi:hypothetical protein